MENKIKVGDILISTFGYDARIACFWKVVARTQKSLKIARLLDHDKTGGWDAGTDKPAKDSRLGEVKTKRLIVKYDDTEMVNTGYGFASIWNGEAVNTYNHH